MAEATIVNFVWTDALEYSLQRTRPDRRLATVAVGLGVAVSW